MQSDAARVSARSGAAEVIQLCLESETEIPASDEEVREAIEDGVTIKHGWGPKEDSLRLMMRMILLRLNVTESYLQSDSRLYGVIC